jgi:hypothetical protein
MNSRSSLRGGARPRVEIVPQSRTVRAHLLAQNAPSTSVEQVERGANEEAALRGLVAQHGQPVAAAQRVVLLRDMDRLEHNTKLSTGSSWKEELDAITHRDVLLLHTRTALGPHPLLG